MYADDTVLKCWHGNAPVKLIDADPDVPYLNDAAFDIGKKATFIDEKNNLAIVLVSKDGLVYEIQVTTAEKVKQLLRYSHLARPQRRLGAVLHPQFIQDGGDVVLDGTLRKEKLGGDLPVIRSLCKQA
jgi:hypothetical protein